MRPLLLPLLLTACTSGKTALTGGPGDTDGSGEDVPALTSTCPADAPSLDGATPSLTTEVSWGTTGRATTAVFAQIPQGVTGLAITVDGGATKTALAWAVLDGRVLIDGSGDQSFGDEARSKRRQVAETAWGFTGDTAVGGSLSLDGWNAAPFFHGPALASTLVMPVNDDTAPAGGCLALLPVATDAAAAGGTGTVTITVNTAPVADDALDVDAVIVQGAGISDAAVQRALNGMFALYAAGGGPSRGAVRLWDVTLPGGAVVPSTDAGLSTLRSTELSGGQARALRMFFVADFSDSSGTLGLAGGIPGPIGVPGTAASGVVVSVDGHRDGGGALDEDLLGETMAHELGHQLGLFHTTESEGDSFDPIDDTPACTASRYDGDGDGEVSAEECADADGTNFMFWTSGTGIRQVDVSATQAFVLDSSPVSHGGTP